MKTLTRIFTVLLLSVLPFACTQKQQVKDKEEMKETKKTLPAAKYADQHQRGHKKARPSPNATVSQTIGTTKVKVSYGRPGVKGRTIFGDLEAYGERWRTGANEATVISFSDSVKIEGQPLPAGAYSLHTIPGETEWTIIFNKKTDAWGTEYDKSQDVLRVDVKSQEAAPMEWFMIYFQKLSETSAEMILHWSKVKVPVTIEV